jgi:hypothetical protein
MTQRIKHSCGGESDRLHIHIANASIAYPATNPRNRPTKQGLRSLAEFSLLIWTEDLIVCPEGQRL